MRARERREIGGEIDTWWRSLFESDVPSDPVREHSEASLTPPGPSGSWGSKTIQIFQFKDCFVRTVNNL